MVKALVRFKVAQDSFQHLDFDGYHKTAKSLMNMLLSFSWHNRSFSRVVIAF